MSEFQRILGEVARLAQEHPRHVVIGGVAVYLHAINNPQAKDTAEASHDGDVIVSLAEFADLRDTDELIANRKQTKHQLVRRGVALDVYVERQNRLIVPFDEASAHAVSYGGIRAAALEHLLVLKVEAYRDRMHSSKGDKDARDVVNIARIAGKSFRAKLAVPFLRDEHVELLQQVAASPVFTYMTRGNAHAAKALRTAFSDVIGSLRPTR